MTKLRALVSITVVLAFAAALAGCPMNNDEDIIPAPLPAPQASLYGSLLSWPAIPGAGGYTVHAGDVQENLPAAGTAIRQIDLADLDLPVGEHSVTVVALGVEGRSLDSPASDPLSFTVNCPGCGNYPCDCDDYPQPIKVEHYSTTIAGIDFGTSGYIEDNLTAEQSIALQAQIDAIRDQFGALDADALAEFTPYVDSLTVSIHPIEGTRIIDLNEDNKAVIYTNSTTVAGIMADLAYGRDKARTAQEQERDNTVVQEATNINNDGINFHIAGGLLTYGQIRAIENMVGGMNVSAFAGYVNSIELADVDGFDVELTGQGQGIMAGITIEYSADAAAIMAALEAARAQVLAEREAAEGAAYWAAIEPNPTNISHGGIDFNVAGGILTRAQVRDIRTMVEGMNVAEFTAYVTSVEFALNVVTPIINTGTGEQAMATIRIDSEAAANAVRDALIGARDGVRIVRDAAREAREQEEREEAERQAAERETAFRNANPIVVGPQNVNGILFTLEGADGFDTRDEADKAVIAGITATIAGQGIQGFAGWGAFTSYITNVTFSNIATPTSTVTGSGANTTATINVPYGITAGELHAFLVETQSDVEDRRTPDTNGPTEFLSLSFEGWTTVLKAVAGIDQAILDAIYADTVNAFDNIFDDAMRRTVANYVASWTLTDEHIDGGWRIIGYDGNRAIVESNTSSTDALNVVLELFVIGDLVSANQARQTMAINAFTDNSR